MFFIPDLEMVEFCSMAKCEFRSQPPFVQFKSYYLFTFHFLVPSIIFQLDMIRQSKATHRISKTFNMFCQTRYRRQNKRKKFDF